MRKKTSWTIGLIMLIVAIAFVIFALTHPTASFPWSNTITYILYIVYFIGVVVFLIFPFRKK